MKDIIEYPEFMKLDLRVGLVKAAEAPEWSNKLLQLTVDFGENIGERQILAGAKNYYEPEEFVGNNYLFLVNLAEKKLGQGLSQGMMLMADEADKPVKFELPADLEPGTVVR